MSIFIKIDILKPSLIQHFKKKVSIIINKTFYPSSLIETKKEFYGIGRHIPFVRITEKFNKALVSHRPFV